MSQDPQDSTDERSDDDVSEESQSYAVVNDDLNSLFLARANDEHLSLRRLTAVQWVLKRAKQGKSQEFAHVFQPSKSLAHIAFLRKRDSFSICVDCDNYQSHEHLSPLARTDLQQQYSALFFTSSFKKGRRIQQDALRPESTAVCTTKNRIWSRPPCCSAGP